MFHQAFQRIKGFVTDVENMVRNPAILLGSIAAFVAGVVLNIPDVNRIGIMFLESLKPATNGAATQIIDSGINTLNILGFGLLIVGILGITVEIKRLIE